MKRWCTAEVCHTCVSLGNFQHPHSLPEITTSQCCLWGCSLTIWYLYLRALYWIRSSGTCDSSNPFQTLWLINFVTGLGLDQIFYPLEPAQGWHYYHALTNLMAIRSCGDRSDTAGWAGSAGPRVIDLGCAAPGLGWHWIASSILQARMLCTEAAACEQPWVSTGYVWPHSLPRGETGPELGRGFLTLLRAVSMSSSCMGRQSEVSLCSACWCGSKSKLAQKTEKISWFSCL